MDYNAYHGEIQYISYRFTSMNQQETLHAIPRELLTVCNPFGGVAQHIGHIGARWDVGWGGYIEEKGCVEEGGEWVGAGSPCSMCAVAWKDPILVIRWAPAAGDNQPSSRRTPVVPHSSFFPLPLTLPLTARHCRRLTLSRRPHLLPAHPLGLIPYLAGHAPPARRRRRGPRGKCSPGHGRYPCSPLVQLLCVSRGSACTACVWSLCRAGHSPFLTPLAVP